VAGTGEVEPDDTVIGLRMDFIKRHYEKVLLGAVLLGLAVFAAFLPIKIAREREEMRDKREKILSRRVEGLKAVDASRLEEAYHRLEAPVKPNFSSPHNLFNPMPWQKRPDGTLIKISTGGEIGPAALGLVKANPLYTVITYESAGADETTYLIGVERQAEVNPALRRKKSSYAKSNVKGEMFTLREATGTPEKREVALEMNDTGERVTISLAQPYRRVAGYTADLKYDPEKRTWLGRRVGDKLVFAGDEFTVASINLVATNQYEVVLSARSTGKKTTIRHNVAM
jgi:hypothetical protein